MDRLFSAYDDGDITRNELFVHLLETLTPAVVLSVRTRLTERVCRQEFEEWLDDVASGAQLYLGGEIVRLPEDARAAIASWRAETRAARYVKFAERVEQWSSSRSNVDPSVEPGDVRPFLTHGIDGLLVEAT